MTTDWLYIYIYMSLLSSVQRKPTYLINQVITKKDKYFYFITESKLWLMCSSQDT